MTKRQQELLAILEGEDIPCETRYRASCTIAQEARAGKIEKFEVPRFYEALVRFWKSFGSRTVDRYEEALFPARKELARCCLTLSVFLPGERRFFKYYPRLFNVEGPHSLKKNETLRGALKCGYGTSLYEFHWEYPIEGFGVRKDLIEVIMIDNVRKPLLDWCEENDIIVFCNRCGLEITHEVSRNCPWRLRKYGAPS
jgi:hypothetical protein